MAFNFTALLGGMASGLSERIDIEEAKLEKAADRAYTAFSSFASSISIRSKA